MSKITKAVQSALEFAHTKGYKEGHAKAMREKNFAWRGRVVQLENRLKHTQDVNKGLEVTAQTMKMEWQDAKEARDKARAELADAERRIEKLVKDLKSVREMAVDAEKWKQKYETVEDLKEKYLEQARGWQLRYAATKPTIHTGHGRDMRRAIFLNKGCQYGVWPAGGSDDSLQDYRWVYCDEVFPTETEGEQAND